MSRKEPKTVKLVAPGHVSVGGDLYERGKDGMIEVPEEHAPHLVESHGCKFPEEQPSAHAGKSGK